MNKKISISLSLVITLIMVNISPAAFAGEQSTAALYDSIKELAQQKADTLVKGYGETSVQYALISHGEIVLSGNSGVFSKTDDMELTSDTMYGIGSVSKMFATASIMKLVDQGKIKLDSPVTEYLPDFKMADDRYKKITVRMLLNHSSGLMGSSFQNAFLLKDNDSFARDNLLEHLKDQRLKADPGAYSVYCNDGFTLAELIVERVCGASFTEFILKYFTSQLGMDRTKTPEDDFDRKQLASTYFPDIEYPTPVDTVNVIGAGGIYSTAEDMCRFAELFMTDSPHTDILSKQSAEETTEKEYRKGIWPREHDNILGYGLGWDCVDTFPMNRYNVQAVVKGGDTLLYHSSFVVLPDHDMAMAVLSSSGSSTYNQAFAMSILLETLKAEGEIDQVKSEIAFQPPEKAVMPDEMRDYAGIYASSSIIMEAAITTDGALGISIPSMPDYPVQELTYTSEGIFKTSDGSGAVGFVKEKNGGAYMTNSGYSSFPALGQVAVMEYSGEKIDPVSMTESTKTAWEARDGKVYYIINEKYTSQIYASMLPVAGVGFLEEAPGYLASNRIIDENTAAAFVQIPGTSGRDMHDYTFYSDDGKDYMKYGSTLLISDDEISGIYTKGSAFCTIGADDYARWFKVSSEDVGKTMTVKLPDHAAFAVYDGNQSCIYHSEINEYNTVKLPENGMIVFIGEKNARFRITYQ